MPGCGHSPAQAGNACVIPSSPWKAVLELMCMCVRRPHMASRAHPRQGAWSGVTNSAYHTLDRAVFLTIHQMNFGCINPEEETNLVTRHFEGDSWRPEPSYGLLILNILETCWQVS